LLLNVYYCFNFVANALDDDVFCKAMLKAAS